MRIQINKHTSIYGAQATKLCTHQSTPLHSTPHHTRPLLLIFSTQNNMNECLKLCTIEVVAHVHKIPISTYNASTPRIHSSVCITCLHRTHRSKNVTLYTHTYYLHICMRDFYHQKFQYVYLNKKAAAVNVAAV